MNIYQFDIFKGIKDQAGKILKIKSVGSAYLREGLRTYTVHLKSLLNERYYLLPNNKKTISQADFVILTREPAKTSGRKYFWNNVGDGEILEGINHGVMHLSWDLFADDIYMVLHPSKVSEVSANESLTSEAA
ncbi:MAG: hypothetical protein ACXWOH_12740 [Bdellovibrionota bacterium]